MQLIHQAISKGVPHPLPVPAWATPPAHGSRHRPAAGGATLARYCLLPGIGPGPADGSRHRLP
ncbi:hypothetical protein ACPEIC_42780, partial [Stenotrophomonas sp. NPDC087984]